MADQKLPYNTLIHMLNIKLSASNFMLWKTQVTHVLRAQKLFGFLDGSLPCPPEPVPPPTPADSSSYDDADAAKVDYDAALSDFENWVSEDQRLCGLLFSSLTEEAMAEVIGCSTSHQIWETLFSVYQNRSKSSVLKLRDQVLNVSRTELFDFPPFPLSMASAKRGAPEPEDPQPKKAKLGFEAKHSEPNGNLQKVVLNPADSDLDFDIEDNGLRGSALHEQGFAYCWSGARANTGITGGKYCFSCKIVDAQPVVMEDTSPDEQNICRVGFSRGDDVLGSLGETPHSFGFGGTGKFSHASRFSNYGDKFGVGDTIVCAVNLENKSSASIGFCKNGKWFGTARSFDAGPSGLGISHSQMGNLLWKSALFPHVLLKNMVIQLQFSIEDGLVPIEGYKPWASAQEDGNAITGPTFCSPGDCEVMMMVGLPASGKTTWAEKWVKDHPEKRYVVLGTNLALDQMKVPGLLRKQNYGQRFERLMERATGIFNTVLSRAAKISRNYIIDQTNVYRSARKRKIRLFENFQKVAVVVFPKPEELKLRGEKRFLEMGKEVPAEAVNTMIANFELPVRKDMPGSLEYFDKVIFPELNTEEAQKHLAQMKRDVKSASKQNLKDDRTPYSHESSVQSFSSYPLHDASTVRGRDLHISQSPLPPLLYDYRRHDQVDSPYQGPGLVGRTGPVPGEYQGSQITPISDTSNTSLSYGSPLPRNDSAGFGSPFGYNYGPSRSYDTGNRIPGYGSGFDPYDKNEVSGQYGRSYYGASPATAFANSPGSAHISDPAVPQAPERYWSISNESYRREVLERPTGYGSPLERTRILFPRNEATDYLSSKFSQSGFAPRTLPFSAENPQTNYGPSYGAPLPGQSYGSAPRDPPYAGAYAPNPRYY